MQGGRFGYFLRATAGLDHRLSDLPIATSSLQLAWSKGFLVLDLLAREIGQQRFAAALRSMLQQFAYQSMTWEEFVRSLETVTQQDLKWFFEQWFDRAGAPEWRVAWRQRDDGTVEGDITQEAPYYRANAAASADAVAAVPSCASRLARALLPPSGQKPNN
jgi:hypothetical protein